MKSSGVRTNFRKLAKVPGTIGLILLTLAVGIGTQSLWHSAEKFGLIAKYGYGIPAFAEGRWWTIFTGAAISPDPWMYILIIATLAFGCGYLEYKYGTLKMLAAVLFTHVASVLVTALVLVVFRGLDISWAVELAKVRDVGMSNAGFGAVGAATAGFSLLWRMRTRFVVILYCITMVLYSGLIWDITHLVAFLVGMAIGPWVVGAPYSKAEYPLLKIHPRTLIAGLVSISVYSTVVIRIFPGNGGIVDFGNAVESTLPAAALIVAVIFSSLFIWGLARGRRFAWWTVCVLSCLSLLAIVSAEPNATTNYEIILHTVIIVLLLTNKRYFTIRSDSSIRRRMILYLLVTFAAVFTAHVALVYSFRNTMQPIVPGFWEVVLESVFQTVGLSTEFFRSTNEFVNGIINGLAYVWIVVALCFLLAFLLSTNRARSPQSHFAVFDSLMRKNGATSITWMARWNGMNYWVNDSNTAAFAYRLVNNVAIVLSDPVGSSQAITSAIKPFHNFCQQNGWAISYFSVTEQFARKLEKQHWQKIVVGEDTQIPLPGLTFAGKKWQSVRSSLNKAEKAGVEMQRLSYANAPQHIKDQLKAIADSWVQDKSLPEMGFTLGTLKETEDAEVVMHIAVDTEGMVHGMTSWMPIYQHNKVIGWTIDIMQRKLGEDTFHGVMEFLIAKTAQAFAQEGYEYISLSAAPLANSAKKKNAIEKLMLVLGDRMEPYYGFKSLYNFKQKFQPLHVPFYLCYKDEAQLPATAAAIGRAYMNDTSYLKAATAIIKK